MERFELKLSLQAAGTLAALERDQKKLKKVRKALGLLQSDPKYPGLNSHPYRGQETKSWESYVENRTPGAWRIWWRYESDEIITVLEIGPHPD